MTIMNIQTIKLIQQMLALVAIAVAVTVLLLVLRWTTVDGYGWTDSDTKVACRQLGLSTSGIITGYF